MKAKLLLCMMLLGLLASSAQQPMPRILDGGFHKMLTPHQFTIETTKTNEATTIAPAPKSNKARADQPTYQVDFVLDFDTETQMANSIEVTNKEYYSENYELEKGSNILLVPEGTYDIIVSYTEWDTRLNYQWPLRYLCVVREQVTVNQNMTLNIAASEAKNHIHFQTLTIDGEPAYTGKWTIDENENWTELEPGNVDEVHCTTRIGCREYRYETGQYTNFGVTVVGEGETLQQASGESLADIFINDVSDRYNFYTYRIATKDNNVYTSTCELLDGVSSDVTISNDPSKFELFEETFQVPQRQNEEKYASFTYSAMPYYFDICWITTVHLDAPLDENETFKCYVSASADECNTFFPHFVPLVQMKTITTTPWGTLKEDYVPILTSMPLTKTNGHTVFANNGAGSFYASKYTEDFTHFEYGYSEEINENLNDYVKMYPRNWPSHPAFTYPIDKKKDILGNNCPILVSNPLLYEMTYSWPDENGTPTSFTYHYFDFNYDYIGRYGEKRPQDITDAEFTIKVNGEDFGTGQGFTRYVLDTQISGEVDATICNEAVIVDDMTGSNNAQLHYYAGVEDQNPPTVTMLHFKDTNGDVTDRFVEADKGMLEFCAGDFNFMLTPIMGYAVYTRQAPESVEVSYSPYGEDNWNELAVEEVSENYWPVMGWFYSGSLAGVTGEGLNGWFDLKIRLTDAAGNWQEQVLSPAFRIDDHAYSSVATLRDNNAHEVARYNLAGQRVDTDATGIVIIRMSDGTARKVLVP